MNVIAKFEATCKDCGAKEMFYDVPFGFVAKHGCMSRTWKLQRRRPDEQAQEASDV